VDTDRLAAALLRRAALAAAWLAVCAPATAVLGQELEPRSYSAAPVGSSFLVAGYSHSSGELLFDTSSPITDARAKINTAVVGYSHVFDLAGHQAGVAALAPYSWGTASGAVGEDRQEISRSGLGDIRIRLSALLAGGPALAPRAFATRKRTPIVGVSLIVVTPTGQYVPTRLINIGANRWAFKPEVGLSYPMGPWQVDAYAGAWLFAKNDDFRGAERTQNALGSFQGHVSYTVRPRLWMALDTTYYTGGVTSLDGVADANRQANLRVGATLSLPVGRRQSIQFNYSRGAVTRFGGDFSTFGVAWQSAWFPSPGR
jgi:hypothetical protein